MTWSLHVATMLLTVALWWGSTALIARQIVRRPGNYATLLVLSSVLGIAGLAAVAALRSVTTTASAFAALVAALLVWSWIEVTFLTGKVTGLVDRDTGDPTARAAHSGFFARAGAAFAAILWHELLIIITVGAVALTTSGGDNDLALLVVLLLWLMRSSAKLNLFLGVRNLGEGFLPPHLRHLLDFMRHRRMNLLMPVSILLGCAIAWHYGLEALGAASTHEAAAATILATLATLAVFEHLLMVLPVPAEALWRWSLADRSSGR